MPLGQATPYMCSHVYIDVYMFTLSLYMVARVVSR